MLSDRIIIDNTWFKKVLAFIGNPITGVIIALLMSFFFYLIGVSSKTPYYYITHPKSLLIPSPEGSMVTFHNQSVRNLYFIDLVLWNNGDDFIDFSDFLSSKPTVLTANAKIRFLKSRVLVKSREGIQSSTMISSDSVIITMKGDEAFEKADGVAYRIFYEINRKNPTKFTLSSRIKGTKNGFQYKDLKNASKARHTKFLIAGWSVLILLLLIRSVTLSILKKPVVFRRSELIFLVLALAFMTYYNYEYIYLSVDLHWIKVN